MNFDKQITFKLDKEMLDFLKQRAASQKISLGTQVRLLLTQKINELKTNGQTIDS